MIWLVLGITMVLAAVAAIGGFVTRDWMRERAARRQAEAMSKAAEKTAADLLREQAEGHADGTERDLEWARRRRAQQERGRK